MPALQFLLTTFLVTLCLADGAPPITPEEAVTRIDQDVVVQMEVKATKDRLEKRGEIYLDSTENFRDPKNLGIVITRTGAANLGQMGITDPATHFKDKTIRVKGV